MLAACAETDAPSTSTAAIGRIRPGFIRWPSLQLTGDVFGVLFVALEDLQAGLQQVLQFRIVRGRNEGRLQRGVDRLVIRNFVGDIGLVAAPFSLASSASLSAAFFDIVLLVSLSCGVTLSFFTRSSACLFTASWSRT